MKLPATRATKLSTKAAVKRQVLPVTSPGSGAANKQALEHSQHARYRWQVARQFRNDGDTAPSNVWQGHSSKRDESTSNRKGYVRRGAYSVSSLAHQLQGDVLRQ